MVVVAKIKDKIVQIVRYSDTVAFSNECGWFCICYDFDKQNRRREQFKWIPVDTRFEWVREYIDA